jgi:hypothetical protein
MSPVESSKFAERKALLTTRAELDRANVTLAVHRIRMIVALAPSPERMARARPIASTVIDFISPLLGAQRLGRWLRFISLALTGLRVARSWRADTQR